MKISCPKTSICSLNGFVLFLKLRDFPGIFSNTFRVSFLKTFIQFFCLTVFAPKNVFEFFRFRACNLILYPKTCFTGKTLAFEKWFNCNDFFFFVKELLTGRIMDSVILTSFFIDFFFCSFDIFKNRSPMRPVKSFVLTKKKIEICQREACLEYKITCFIVVYACRPELTPKTIYNQHENSGSSPKIL